MRPSAYEFTNRWFEQSARDLWDSLLPRLNPARMLEIGCYEGASTCYLIDHLTARQSVEIHCIDTWEGGLEHQATEQDMATVEERFVRNTRLAIAQARHPVQLVVHKARSDLALAQLIASGKQGHFDFIYIDGSHQAPDVLCDAVLSFRLLKTGGVIAFDDYLWQEPLPYGTDPIRCPKPAIDAFTNLYCRKTRILSAPLYQLYVQKISD